MPIEPLHPHQSALEKIFDFSARPPLNAAQRQAVEERFTELIERFNQPEGEDGEYNRDESKGNFLRAFFESIGTPINEDFSTAEIHLSEAALRTSIFSFADYLFENFFLPLKASTRKTPQPTPGSQSAVLALQQGAVAFLGTPERVSALRGACLIRDRHRCVITRRFDVEQLKKQQRASQGHHELQDDDGNPLGTHTRFSNLEVAHILPHSLTRLNPNNELDPSKVAALAILNMFDVGAAFLIEGINIDRPGNALTLTPGMHYHFGAFDIYFESVEGQSHTYNIRSFLMDVVIDELPTTRTLFLAESRTIDPPSSRLLAIHRAIGHILHLSGAGGYIDDIIRDYEELHAKEDGSTQLDLLVKLKLQLQGDQAGQDAIRSAS
ncbi:unnamed protein product [Clonostachys rosea f. rosea IK726]|uniref:HNH nuclease domain-containing protein n=2 Tax=Bionectria ochroleuca TaxID=29856 RepID=A0A0B7K0W1_BIOOC|nr:unnamed protein product [Clonostachys rosea f. rosea IK726]